MLPPFSGAADVAFCSLVTFGAVSWRELFDNPSRFAFEEFVVSSVGSCEVLSCLMCVEFEFLL